MAPSNSFLHMPSDLSDRPIEWNLRTIAGVVIVFYSIYILLRAFWNLFFHPLARVPGPLFAKISGLYIQPASIAGRRAHKLRSLHDYYGPIVRVAPNEVSVSDPKSYRQIYANRNAKKTEEFYKHGKFRIHDTIFSFRNKSQHSARRKMYNVVFSHQKLVARVDFITAKAERLVSRIKRSVSQSSGNVVDVFPICAKFSLEVITKFMYDKDFDEDDTDLDFFVSAMEDVLIYSVLNIFFGFIDWLRWGHRIPGPIGNSIRVFLRWEQLNLKFLNTFIQKKQPAESGRVVYFADPLFSTKDEVLGRKLTLDEIVEEALGIAFAGSGTTATTISYLLYALSRPEGQHYQRRLREELSSCEDDYAAVKDLPFLNAVIKETLRRYPTISGTLPRILEEDLIIQSYRIPKGSFIGMQNYVHQRNPDVFPQPDLFLPERWLESGDSVKAKDKTDALTPFSLGSRNCIGQDLAKLELIIATNKIFRNLKLSLDSSMTVEDMELVDRFAATPKGRKLLLNVEDISK